MVPGVGQSSGSQTNSSLRIVYFHQYFFTPDQAGGTRSYEMAKRLVSRGHKVTMVTSGFGVASSMRKRKVTLEDGFEVIYLPVSMTNDMSVVKRMISFALFSLRASWCGLTLPCDLVFATSTPLTITLPGMLAALRWRVPYVFEVRDMWPDVPIALGALTNPLAKRLAVWMEAVTYRFARQIVALAPGMKAEIIAKGVPESKVKVIPNGCDIDLFGKAGGPEAEALREQLPASVRHAKIVYFAGMLGFINRVEYLGELAAEMAKLSDDVIFVVCGQGRNEADLEQQAAASGVLGKNLFMMGLAPKVDVARWLSISSASICLIRNLDVLVRNAVQNKFFDSIAAGVPVAYNFEGWQTQLAGEADVGISLDPNDAAAGAKSLLKSLQDDNWMQGAPQRCLQLASRFDRGLLADELDKVFAEAVNEHRR